METTNVNTTPKTALRPALLLPMLIAASPFAEAAVTIGSDNFDTSVAGVDYTTRTITNSSNTATVTFNIVNRTNLANAAMIDTSTTLGGVVALNAADNIGFLSASKTDRFFGMYRAGDTRILSYTFSIASYDSLGLSFDWATTGSVATDRLATISYSIDGGAPSTIFTAGIANNTDWNETFDGGLSTTRADSWGTTVNGAAGANLTDTFQTFSPTITGTGSILTINVVQSSTVGGYGGYGMDNLVLSGTLIPEPSSSALVAIACGSFVMRRRRQ